jgi:hypothetical protein
MNRTPPLTTRRAEQDPDRLLEGHGQQHRGNRGDRDKEKQAPARPPLGGRALPQHRQQQPDPVAPEINQQRRRRT